MRSAKKILILVGDGMGDYPIPELGNRTPLQAANIPNMRRIASAGKTYMVQTVPDGMTPGSDVANLCIMGLDPRRYYTGRAPIEAVGAGIAMRASDVAFRCNLVNVENGVIMDHSSGHITTEEARPIIDSLNASLGDARRRFFAGAGYRHLLLWEHGPAGIEADPPHDVLGQQAARHFPRGPGAGDVMALMEASKPLLAEHPINRKRRAAGKTATTQIWLWGQGRQAALPSFSETFGLHGGMISAVDLLRGIGRLCGLEAISLHGATGYLDTNYAGKVQAAINALKEHNFAFLHVEAPDECSHAGNLALKIEAIEAFDKNVVGPAWHGLEAMGCAYRLLLCTDHRTPVSVRNHTIEPVPLAIFDGPLSKSTTAEAPFDETINNGRACCLAFELISRNLEP